MVEEPPLRVQSRQIAAVGKGIVGMRVGVWGSALTLACLLLTGCVTPQQEEVNNAVHATYKIARNLERDLGDTVEQLNTTTAELIARVDQTDQQTRQLQAVAEENQVKMDALQKKLDELARVLYDQYGLTVPSGYGSSRVNVTVPGSDADLVETTPTPGTTPAGAPPAGSTTTPPTTVGQPTTSGPLPGPVTDYYAANKAFVAEDYQKALELFENYLRLYPNTEYTPSAEYYRAHCLYLLERLEEAIDGFKRFRERHPSNSKVPVAMFNQAGAHKMLGQNEQAIDLWKQIVQHYPMSGAAERAKKRLEDEGQG